MYDLVIPYAYDRLHGGIELKYSILSARKFMPINNIYIIGDKSKEDAIHIRYPSSTYKQRNIISKIRLACTLDISDPFICMSDDVYLTRPWEFQYYHNGRLDEKRRNGLYKRYMDKTMQAGGVYHFDIHAPILYGKDFLDRVPVADTLIQSMYCRGEQGVELADCKINSKMSYDEIKHYISGHPRWSSGPSGVNDAMRRVWKELYLQGQQELTDLNV